MIGFVGASKIAERHISIIKKLKPEYEFIIFSKFKKPKNKNRDKITFTNDIYQFINHNPEWTIISTAPINHHLYIDKIVNVSKKVLIEKPISASMKHAKDILSAKSSIKCKVVIGYNLRFLKTFEKAKEILDTKSLGKLYGVNVEVGKNLEDWRPDTDILNSITINRTKGGGVLRELSHELDLMYCLFGTPIKSSMVSCKTRFHKYDIEDIAYIHARYSSKVSNDGSHLASINMDFVRCDASRKMIFIYENGTLICDFINGSIHVATKNNIHCICKYDNDIDNSYIRMWEAFSENKFDQFCSVEAACETLSLIEKLEKECM